MMETGCGTGAGLSGNQPERHVWRPPQPESPCSHILRLFLHPNVLSSFVGIHYFIQLSLWHGIKLFNANDGYILPFIRLLLLEKVVIHFPRAEKHAFYLRLRNVVVSYKFSETSCGQLF